MLLECFQKTDLIQLMPWYLLFTPRQLSTNLSNKEFCLKPNSQLCWPTVFGSRQLVYIDDKRSSNEKFVSVNTLLAFTREVKVTIRYFAWSGKAGFLSFIHNFLYDRRLYNCWYVSVRFALLEAGKSRKEISMTDLCYLLWR